MSAAAILRQARGDGLELSATPAGNIKVRGPREAVAAWTPIVIKNKDALLAELSSGLSRADVRASVDALLADMAAENDRRRGWWREPVDGWREGRMEWRNVVTGETTVIRLAKRRTRH
jgi:hypothetical protein